MIIFGNFGQYIGLVDIGLIAKADDLRKSETLLARPVNDRGAERARVRDKCDAALRGHGRLKKGCVEREMGIECADAIGAEQTHAMLARDVYAVCFERRTFCPPELLLLAVGHVARQTEGELGIDLLLTPPRREAVCRLCLLEPAALDRALNWMLPLYPTIVVPGTTAGTYGRFLRFLRWPTLADVAAR